MSSVRNQHAPEPYRSACLEVTYRAVIYARPLGWQGSSRFFVRASKAHSEQLADLLDAVHNLPQLLQNWEHVDEPRIRSYLAAYDEKWGDRNTPRLLPIYEQALRDATLEDE